MVKRSLLVMLATVLVAAGGCRVPQVGQIKGSGVPLTERRNVQDFDRIDAGGFGDLSIVFGEGEFVIIEGDDNVVPEIETVVRGGTLHIGLLRGNYDPNLPLTITVGARDLTGVEVSGAIAMTAEMIRGTAFELAVSGAASATIDRLEAREFDVTVSGAGDCTVRGGRVEFHHVNASGAGTYEAVDLESRSATVSSSGAGDITIFVTDELDADASGAGTIMYRGSPEVRTRTSGAGSVERVS
jgi:hypothetical protein